MNLYTRSINQVKINHHNELKELLGGVAVMMIIIATFFIVAIF